MPTLTGAISGLNDVDGNELLNRAIEAHYDEIVAAVGRRGHSRAAALDIVHDLYVKLAARPHVLREKRSIGAFLCRAAINLGIDRFRRERFEARLFSGSEYEAQSIAAEGTAPDRALAIEARIAILRDAIGELPVRRRAVFILHRLHGLTPDEIARKLGISRNMVDRHLRRALAYCLDRLLQID
ncbi:RNA polymerase sigma factor [Bosea sp. NPDC003192]|jgi:RNA polymerase sigma factor (sigma-70 family)|uniref:RNA polymerase sigma factor n=1 Tax=Bosea sp. NPDC003192 TaxID=3390551 RepID=UPI003CFC6758